MASISDAVGTVEIEASSSEAIEELKKHFKTWQYNIFCKDLDDKKILKSTTEEIEYGHLLYYAICWFNGKGDESFPATLKIFQDWLEKKVILYNQLLRDSEFRFTFKYVDQNSKLNFINESQRLICHAPGEEIISSLCNYEFNYDYTLVNKAICLGKNLGKIIADELEDKSNLEVFVILQKNRGSVEEFTGKLLEVFLYEQGLDHYAEMCS